MLNIHMSKLKQGGRAKRAHDDALALLGGEVLADGLEDELGGEAALAVGVEDDGAGVLFLEALLDEVGALFDGGGAVVEQGSGEALEGVAEEAAGGIVDEVDLVATEGVGEACGAGGGS